ncbi:unnamed protein product [Lactuca virosa]|uniref:Uncharacterized protein n=1 Tax=Lactuca virosa TaxID=75947 RepID=A0AAU9P588_9ASTR|nr:unnamed protein product [Lactuca virosa]
MRMVTSEKGWSEMGSGEWRSSKFVVGRICCLVDGGDLIASVELWFQERKMDKFPAMDRFLRIFDKGREITLTRTWEVSGYTRLPTTS